MWAGIRKNWDYVALTFVLGVYVTAAAAVAVTLMLLTAGANPSVSPKLPAPGSSADSAIVEA